MNRLVEILLLSPKHHGFIGCVGETLSWLKYAAFIAAIDGNPITAVSCMLLSMTGYFIAGHSMKAVTPRREVVFSSPAREKNDLR
jgi:hypothetical protein